VRQQISSAVDLIIQQTRLKDGSRKVTAVTEVVGMEGDTVVMTDIFKFEQQGVGRAAKYWSETAGIAPSSALFGRPGTLSGEIFMPSASSSGHRR
jgi:pilus assembly protein CpaF